jgi:predicted dehydrogenase
MLVSMSRPVNWLVIGIGDIARKRVIPAIQAEPRSRFHAVVTRDPAKAEAYPGVRAYTDLSASLQDSEVNAVYVASPVALHAEHSIASLSAGKNVLCEKPVAMNFVEAEQMAAAQHDTGRLLGIAYFRRFFPKLIRTRELIAQNAIGKPLFAEVTCHGWLEGEERAWLRDPTLAGGGPLYDVGSHRIDACNSLFGKPQRAVGLRANVLHQLSVEDSATTLIQYASGVNAVIDVRWNSRIQRDEFRVVGVDGEIILNPLNGPALRLTTSDGTVLEENLPAHSNVHFPLVENFASAMLDGHPLACPIDEAIWTDWVTEQVMRDRPC